MDGIGIKNKKTTESSGGGKAATHVKFISKLIYKGEKISNLKYY